MYCLTVQIIVNFSSRNVLLQHFPPGSDWKVATDGKADRLGRGSHGTPLLAGSPGQSSARRDAARQSDGGQADRTWGRLSTDPPSHTQSQT